MTTIVKILGQEPQEKQKKKIEFVSLLTIGKTFSSVKSNPDDYKNIELICQGYCGKFDIMFAYDNDRSMGYLYLGHFNDGIV